MIRLEELGIGINFTKIKVDTSKLESLASSLVELKVKHKGFDWVDDNYWLSKKEPDESVSQFFTLGNSINF
ncbi:hypothetical protein, partial [Candidatus Nitrosarchaeum limnium]